MYRFPARRGRARHARFLCLLLLALGLIALVAGCGSSGSSDSTASSGSSASEAETETASQDSGESEGGDLAIGKVGDPSEFVSIKELCGEETLVVGIADGFGGNTWRQITRAEAEEEAAECPNIEKVIYTDGQNNTQKYISDINSLVAQGANVIITLDDAGPAGLPALKQAYEQGVAVVPYIGDPGGTPGVDYTDYVSENVENNGVVWAEWMVEALNGKGNIVFLGGTPGNPVSEAEGKGIEKVLAENPGVKLLAGPVTTNWEPAETQKVMAGLLTKYPQIDGVISDYGGGSIGAIQAFTAAGRELVPFATNDQNGFACEWEKLKAANPNFQIATISSRNWMSRLALRKGVAAAEGLPDEEPSLINLPLIENSITEKPPVQCDESLSSEAILSTELPPEKLKEVVGG